MPLALVEYSCTRCRRSYRLVRVPLLPCMRCSMERVSSWLAGGQVELTAPEAEVVRVNLAAKSAGAARRRR